MTIDEQLDKELEWLNEKYWEVVDGPIAVATLFSLKKVKFTKKQKEVLNTIQALRYKIIKEIV